MAFIRAIRLLKRVYFAIKYRNLTVLYDESIVMKNVIDCLKIILIKKDKVTYLETGSIRSYFEFHWSTFM